MSGPHYAKELADRIVITWDISEPFGNIQNSTWFKTINRFQLVLHRNGSIEMSYKELAAKDAIVGIYPELSDTRNTRGRFMVSRRRRFSSPDAVSADSLPMARAWAASNPAVSH